MLKKSKTIKVHDRTLCSGCTKNRNIFEVFNHIYIKAVDKMQQLHQAVKLNHGTTQNKLNDDIM